MKNFKNLIILIISFFPIFSSYGQVVEVQTKEDDNNFLAGENKPGFFGTGFIDYGLEGQVQASAQVLKIFIGEPNGFKLPLYLFVGTTNSTLGVNEINKSVLFDIISPTGGLLNASGNFYTKKINLSQSGITHLSFNMFFGGKLLSGRNIQNKEAQLSLGAYLDPGFYFQTGAWDAEGGYEEGGVFWLQAKYLYTYTSSGNLKDFFGTDFDSSPHGPKLELGVFIKNKVNLKISYFKALGSENLPTLDDGQFKISVDYSVSK